MSVETIQQSILQSLEVVCRHERSYRHWSLHAVLPVLIRREIVELPVEAPKFDDTLRKLKPHDSPHRSLIMNTVIREWRGCCDSLFFTQPVGV